MGLESIIDKTKNFLVKGILMASIGLSGVAGCATIDSNNKAPTINLVNLSDTGCSKKTILMLGEVSDEDSNDIDINLRTDAQGVKLKKHDPKNEIIEYSIIGNITNTVKGVNNFDYIIEAADEHGNSAMKNETMVFYCSEINPKLLINTKLSYGYLLNKDNSSKHHIETDIKGTFSSKENRIIYFYDINAKFNDINNYRIKIAPAGIMGREKYKTTRISTNLGFDYTVHQGNSKPGLFLKIFGDEIGESSMVSVIDDLEYYVSATTYYNEEWSSEAGVEMFGEDLLGFGLLTKISANHFKENESSYLNLDGEVGIKYRINIKDQIRIDLRTKGSLNLVGDNKDPSLLLELMLEY
ncbi:hypothetical protein HOL59_06190 [Candidatus Woesearchaeota archaeon]|nr:hypothetical protein [Candidatus Woesearchaeota archaeon]